MLKFIKECWFWIMEPNSCYLDTPVISLEPISTPEAIEIENALIAKEQFENYLLSPEYHHMIVLHLGNFLNPNV